MAKTYSLAKDGNTRLSAHFKVSEFKCKSGNDEILIDDKLWQGLESLWSYFANISPIKTCQITINSAYRDPKYNAEIKGATKSRHMYGEAADITVAYPKYQAGPFVTADPKEVYIAAEQVGFSGIGLYNTFTHVDVRPWQSRWNFSSDKTVSTATRENAGTLADDSVADDYNIHDTQNAKVATLLEPSFYEKKYGISVYDANQPLIKFSTAQGVGASDALSALQSYAKYIFFMLNSAMDVASMTLPAAPWLRPGFNIWVDPVAIDKIYYINKIQHMGNASNNTVVTSLTLSFGRDRLKYQNGKVNFGAEKTASKETDNIFINKFYENSSVFGKLVSKAKDFNYIRSKIQNFYQNDSGSIIHALNNQHYSEFYGTSNTDSSITAMSATGAISSSGYAINDGIYKLNSTGNSVKGIAWVLTQEGYNVGNAMDTGIYNASVVTAVRKFQTTYRLQIDGTTGPATIAKMRALYPQLTTTKFTSSIPSSTMRPMHGEFATIADIQNALNSMYSSAPQVVRDRGQKLSKVIIEADDYIRRHYESESLYTNY